MAQGRLFIMARPMATFSTFLRLSYKTELFIAIQPEPEVPCVSAVVRASGFKRDSDGNGNNRDHAKPKD